MLFWLWHHKAHSINVAAKNCTLTLFFPLVSLSVWQFHYQCQTNPGHCDNVTTLYLLHILNNCFSKYDTQSDVGQGYTRTVVSCNKVITLRPHQKLPLHYGDVFKFDIYFVGPPYQVVTEYNIPTLTSTYGEILSAIQSLQTFDTRLRNYFKIMQLI